MSSDKSVDFICLDHCRSTKNAGNSLWNIKSAITEYIVIILMGSSLIMWMIQHVTRSNRNALFIRMITSWKRLRKILDNGVKIAIIIGELLYDYILINILWKNLLIGKRAFFFERKKKSWYFEASSNETIMEFDCENCRYVHKMSWKWQLAR